MQEGRIEHNQSETGQHLSDRLFAVASLVTPGSRLADIGTDHGFVPIFLVQRGIVPSAIAMDVNRGPLERAQAHIREQGLEERIETRLSDGLEELARGEADTVLIAGMGGALTGRILAAHLERIRPAELVLQPQSELARVRRFLERSGWCIDRECMVEEEGKFYPMMQCHPGGMPLTDEEAAFGPLLIKQRDPVLARYLGRQAEILRANLARLPQPGSARTQQRRGELQERLAGIESVQEIIQQDSMSKNELL